MKQFTTEEIQAQFETLPKEVQDAVVSSGVNDKLKALAGKYDLHIDQLEDLVDEVGLTMLGLRKSSYFVGDLCSRLSIDKKTAESIATEINTDIFSIVREHLRSVDAQADADAEAATAAIVDPRSDLERFGGFTIDKTATAGNTTENGYVEKRPEILDSIENPQPAPRTYVSNTSPEVRTEPLIDHLLTTPVVIPPQNIEQPVSALPTIPVAIKIPTPPAPQKSAGPDPYKEPVN